MKYTTAKTIMKIYRREGRFGKKKQRMKKGYGKLGFAMDSGKETEEKLATPTNGSCDLPCSSGESILKELKGQTQDNNKSESALYRSFWGERMTAHCC